ncbi:probable ATP-dependent DNA helicase HFM1 [Clytia hemisphaerica]|uniref:probable ATP-dependent DNA helicase HFM1 n=1 Tax=Clytia hemisphaerica TaxID=252671 RepID=UPI0034D60BD1
MTSFANNDGGFSSQNAWDDLPPESLRTGFGNTQNNKRRKLDFNVSANQSYGNNTFLNKTVPPETPANLQLQVGNDDDGSHNLKSIHEIPEKYRPIFPFAYFNALQSKVFDEVIIHLF